MKKKKRRKARNRYRDFAEYLVFRIIVCIVGSLPTRASVWLAEAVAGFVHFVLPRKLSRYNVAAENVRTAFPEYSEQQVDQTIYGMWVHLFRMVVEIVHIPQKVRLYNCADVMRFRNRDQIVNAMCSGRPVMMLAGHFGNWEMANCSNGSFGFPMGVVARDLDNPFLHGWFERFRRHTGHRTISKNGGTAEMVQTMENRGILGLLGDQDAGRRGLFVDFFGKPASTFKSIALLAMQHNAVICVGYGRRLPDDFRKHRWVRYEIGCEAVIDPQEIEADDLMLEITRQYTAALERIVRLAPEQYFWVHRRWKTVQRQRVRKAVAA